MATIRKRRFRGRTRIAQDAFGTVRGANRFHRGLLEDVPLPGCEWDVREGSSLTGNVHGRPLQRVGRVDAGGATRSLFGDFLVGQIDQIVDGFVHKFNDLLDVLFAQRGTVLVVGRQQHFITKFQQVPEGHVNVVGGVYQCGAVFVQCVGLESCGEARSYDMISVF